MMPAGADNPQSRQETAPESGRLGAASGATARRRRQPRMPGLAMLPSMLTLGNAVCGVAAMIELFKAFAAVQTWAGTHDSGSAQEVYLRLGYAALLIGAGTLFDALDGKVARMTASTGRFGAELDSLCDAVTFGVAPALMLRVGGEFFFARYPFDTKILWAVSGLYVCCALLRLARFNVESTEDDDHTTFKGLPTPAAAASVAGLILGCTWLHEFEPAWFQGESAQWLMRVLIPLIGGFIGLTMVSRIRSSHRFRCSFR
jgi:CDP-diacylglycerol--serine O-phosphatidyltransferase